MITTDCGIHSPEIAYLENGRNGFITPQDTAAYVACVVHLLGDEGLRQMIAANAMADARKYTLEQIVENFADGVLRAVKGEE